MSLYFNDTSTKKGIIQEIESECGLDDGAITNDTDLFKKFTVSVNLALDDFWAIAIPASGKWQLDDSNYDNTNGGYPIITANIVSGQRDYPFTTDGSGNLILDVYKVMVADSTGYFREIKPVDQQNDLDMESFYNGQNASGVPTRYDKTANGIFLDVVPNYSRDASLKVFINREASYFTTAHTTRKPGVPGIFHRYFVLKPSLDYARRYLTTDAYNKIRTELKEMEEAIKYHFAGRDRGAKRSLNVLIEDCE